MTKQTITNTSPGPRTINVVGENKKPLVLTLAPGESRSDVEIVNPNDRVFKGMVNNRELTLGNVKEETDEEKQKREVERFRNDPHARANRQAAEGALRAGLADPLPEDTDTEGGEEAEEARRNAASASDEQEETETQGRKTRSRSRSRKR